MVTVTLGTTSTFQLGSGPTLNSVDANGVIWRINPDGVDGWGEPPTTLTPVQKVRARGAWAGDSYTTGRPVAISGTIMAPTPPLLNVAIDSLIDSVTASPFQIISTESGVPWSITARRQGETIIKKVTNLFAAYSIQVFALDPRKFGTPLVGTTLLPVSTGGLTWPETWPETWAGATTVSGTVTLRNPGNTTGAVILRVDGPATGPSIAHIGSSAAITFAASLVMGGG
jgi:hypothetical protein